MDSLTQIILGASVSEACIGKKIGNKAPLWGAIAGTIPDLDVLAEHLVDNITALQLHRGISHSVFFSILAALIMGWALSRFYPNAVATRKDWTIAMFAALFTHPLLDAFTTWGTQIFWPFETRVAIKSIFVIDPTYSLPFLLCLLLAMMKRRDDIWRRKFNNAGLYLSTGYLVLTLVLKGLAYQEFKSSLQRQGIPYVDIQTRPTPFNTILWAANVKTETGYLTANYSLFDKQAEINFSAEIPRNNHLLDEIIKEKKVQQLIDITNGWYTIKKEGDRLFFNDLRFGQLGMDNTKAQFVFSYELLYDQNGEFQAPEREKSMQNAKEMTRAIFERMKGN